MYWAAIDSAPRRDMLVLKLLGAQIFRDKVEEHIHSFREKQGRQGR